MKNLGNQTKFVKPKIINSSCLYWLAVLALRGTEGMSKYLFKSPSQVAEVRVTIFELLGLR
jgi:hypothetical protein